MGIRTRTFQLSRTLNTVFEKKARIFITYVLEGSNFQRSLHRLRLLEALSGDGWVGGRPKEVKLGRWILKFFLSSDFGTSPTQ